MLTTKRHTDLKRKRASLIASFFLVIAVFMLTGLLPQYLEYLDADCIEFSESLENESQEKEKETEKETDKYSTELTLSPIVNLSGLHNPDGHFHKWQNPSVDIITPPPDFI